MDSNFTLGKELLKICSENNMNIWEVMMKREISITDQKEHVIIDEMRKNLGVMKEAIKKGLYQDIKSVSGLTGGDAKKLRLRYENQSTVSGKTMNKAIASAMATLEVNASMGRIVAAPTAGSSGILPACMITVGEKFGLEDDILIRGLFTASAIGMIIATNATVAGAEGGCQAETGAASAMAAAGMVEMLGGTPKQALDAASMTIKNIMGLVCDPIAGLVEAPCVKRNAIGTANAFICCDMALAGIKSIIPFDEVIEAMYRVGRSLPCELRETALGGIANTPTAKKIEQKIFRKEDE